MQISFILIWLFCNNISNVIISHFQLRVKKLANMLLIAKIKHYKFKLKPLAFIGLSTFLFSNIVFSQNNNVTELDVINIATSGLEETSTSKVEGYQAKRSSSATRTDTAIGDIPQAISVIGSEVVQDLASSRIDDALDFAGGVARGNNFGGLQMFGLSLRGFTSTNGGFIYYNGFATKGTNAAPDIATIERIEILKGPTSGLYGAGDPGGVINLVSKRPEHHAFADLAVTAGNWDRYYTTLDANAPITNDVLVRVNLALEDNDSFRDYVGNKRYVFAPAISFNIGENSYLLWHNELSRTDLNLFDRGVFPINGNWRAMNKKHYLGEPSNGRNRTDTELSQLTFEHNFNSDWLIRIASQYRHGTLDGKSTEPMAPVAGSIMAKRRFRDRDFSWRSNDYRAESVGHITTGGIEHTLLLGVEYGDAHSRSRFPQTNFAGYDINALYPKYANAPHPSPLSMRDYYAYQENYAFNVQNQLQINKQLSLLAGVRFDKFKVKSVNNVNKIHTYSKSDQAFVPRLGVIYKFNEAVSIFANGASSFKPNLDENDNYKIYDPVKGKGYEIGTKFNLFDERLSATIAAFQISKNNALRTLNDGTTAASGKEQSKGIDAQINGAISDQTKLILAYAYIETEIKQGTANTQGMRFANVPLHNLGILINHHITDSLNIGVQSTYVSKRNNTDDRTNNVVMPEYAIASIITQYQVTPDLKLKFNLNNIFNKEYFERGGFSGSAMPGEPRNFKVGINYSF